MADIKHTPGPWKWDRDQLLGADPGEYASDAVEHYDDDGNVTARGALIVETDGGFYPPRAPDRALIAAAPDLLGACEEAADELDAVVAYDPGKDYGGHYNVDDAARIVATLRVAIAKAKGTP